MSNSFESDPKEILQLVDAITLQATAYGIDTDNDNVKLFIKHQAEVMAAAFANVRMLQNILHVNTFRGDYADT